MSEMKLNLTNGIMKSLVTKILRKVIRKKFGCDIEIELNNVHVLHKHGRVFLHVDADVETSQEDFVKLIKQSGIDEEDA